MKMAKFILKLPFFIFYKRFLFAYSTDIYSLDES